MAISAHEHEVAISHHEVVIESNEPLAINTYRLRFHCPEIARQILPGQFVMLRLANRDDPVLGRALAMYDTVRDNSGKPVGIELVYLVVGKMTRLLAQSPIGTRLTVWGQLGNGFSLDPVDHLILVSGGIGQTPLLSLGKTFKGRDSFGSPSKRVEPARKVSLCHGVRTKKMLAGIEDFEQAEIDVHLSSDDGSIGHHGFTTDLLSNLLEEDAANAATGDSSHGRIRIACCGPVPMMKRVAQIAKSPSATPGNRHFQEPIPCEVSLETPMACGIGICFSCVARIVQPDGSEDYLRTCVDGPIFDATKIIWPE